MKPSKLPFSAAAACLLLFASSAHAQNRAWHVSSIGGQPRDFSSVVTAIGSPLVQDGDTLIISGNFEEGFSLNRQLHLVGYGYFHTENGLSHPPTTQMPAAVNDITIDAGATTRADGGSITGITADRITFRDVDGFTFRRNNIGYVYLRDGVTGSARRISIIQNYMRGIGGSPYYTISSGLGDNSDILVASNIILPAERGCVALSSGDLMVFTNNIIVNINVGYGASLNLSGAGLFVNNVVYAGFNQGLYTVQNNLAIGGDHLPAGNGNINGELEADVFVLDASPDGKYKLKPGSPAIGAGKDGADIGPYGGSLAYVLSGLPPIPVITEISAPLTVNDGETLSVQIRAEVHP